MTAKELRDKMIEICDRGFGDLPVSNDCYDATSYTLLPRVMCVAPTDCGDLFFTLEEVKGGAPKMRGIPDPDPTFVLVN